jgi:putative transferase (TIGR04331 family)
MQDHQLAISDYFLSWGWTNLSEKKIKPFGNFKISGGSVIPRKKGNLLLVEMAIPRFSYHMYSLPVSACQFSHYLNEQFSFVNFLPKKIQKKLIVRHHSEDYNLAITKRWKDMFPEITLSNNNSFFNAMENSRLIIATYNATTFLESLSLNFPTIIFWNKNYWEMNEEATIQFKILTDVGIFHFTPKSAADQVEKVWDNIEEWWCSNEVQIARNNFCNSYARNINNPSADLVGFIEGVC